MKEKSSNDGLLVSDIRLNATRTDNAKFLVKHLQLSHDKFLQNKDVSSIHAFI